MSTKYEKPIARDLNELQEAAGTCSDGGDPQGQCTPTGSAPGNCYTYGWHASGIVGCSNGPVAFDNCGTGITVI